MSKKPNPIKMSTAVPDLDLYLRTFIRQGGTWKQLQGRFLRAALYCCHGNRTQVAAAIKVSIRTIRIQMQIWKLRGIDYGQAENQ